MSVSIYPSGCFRKDVACLCLSPSVLQAASVRMLSVCVCLCLYLSPTILQAASLRMLSVCICFHLCFRPLHEDVVCLYLIPPAYSGRFLDDFVCLYLYPSVCIRLHLSFQAAQLNPALTFFKELFR